MANRLSYPVTLLMSVALLLGCSPEETAGSRAPTFHRDVQPIVQRSCEGCHSEGGLAPFSLTSYEQASSMATMIVHETEERRMPPWGAVESEECEPRHPWKDDARLTDDEIAILREWKDAGAPEGDAADAPPKTKIVADSLPGVEQELTMRAPHVTHGDSDEFMCFLLDPGLTSTAYLNGFHVRPGNRKVAHHAAVYADVDRITEPLADANGAFPCFGGAMGTDGADIRPIGLWLPGALPFELPPNIGTPIPAGSLIVMQMHYHPAGAGAEPDQTTVQLRYTAEKPEWLMSSTAVGNYPAAFPGGDGLQPGPNDGPGGPEFRVPANVAGHVERMQITIPPQPEGEPLQEVRLYAAAAHMHYIGTDLLLEVERAVPEPGEAAEECLLHEPHWNFDWQRTYTYDAPIDQLFAFKVGDRIKVRCLYDNTIENPFVQRGLVDAKLPSPIDAVLGEETLDEMCIGILGFLFRTP